MPISMQVIYLFLLAMPIACIAWTVTHEEVFREPRDFCLLKSKTGNTLIKRKFFYLFTCEYCFSHYVTIFALILSEYHLMFVDWRGYVFAGFSLVWISNLYMALFALIRIDIKKEKTEITVLEKRKSINQLTEKTQAYDVQ